MINMIATNRATQPMAGTISHNVSSFMAQGYGTQFTPIVIRWDIVLMLKRGRICDPRHPPLGRKQNDGLKPKASLRFPCHTQTQRRRAKHGRNDEAPDADMRIEQRGRGAADRNTAILTAIPASRAPGRTTLSGLGGCTMSARSIMICVVVPVIRVEGGALAR